ncbi:MAG: exodeoxyribonuclease III [Lentisphaerae bacterium]|nr:exodeoxyribonuclease III [Lentisphaerota bacterium]
MTLTIATFNVNSVRSRMPMLLQWLDKASADIVCLQETKVQDHEFPQDSLREAGYHVTFKGQKSYNGVAILSRSEPSTVINGFDDGGPADESRLLIAEVEGVVVVNTYVPQGRDIDHEMYQYKLQWFDRLRSLFETKFSPDQPIVWVGDINVAPTDIDIHDPKRLLGHVCFNPLVIEAFRKVTDWGFVDVFRKHVPEGGHYTYYDYRAKNAIESGKGWRIDHIQATKPLADRSINSWIDLEPRLAAKPSDHTPLMAEFES